MGCWANVGNSDRTHLQLINTELGIRRENRTIRQFQEMWTTQCNGHYEVSLCLRTTAHLIQLTVLVLLSDFGFSDIRVLKYGTKS